MLKLIRWVIIVTLSTSLRWLPPWSAYSFRVWIEPGRPEVPIPPSHTIYSAPTSSQIYFPQTQRSNPPELSQKMGSSCPFTPLLYLKQQKKGEQTKMDKGTGNKWKPCISRHLSSCLLWMQLRDTGVRRGKSESPALFLASSFLENSWSHFLFEGDTIRASSVIAAGIIPTSENIFLPNI